MVQIARGELRFLIINGISHINLAPNSQSPSHIQIAYLLNAVTKNIARTIENSNTIDEVQIQARRLIGPAILGGYCRMISADPPKFEYIRGSTTVQAAEKKDFDESNQQPILDHITDDNLYASDYY